MLIVSQRLLKKKEETLHGDNCHLASVDDLDPVWRPQEGSLERKRCIFSLSMSLLSIYSFCSASKLVMLIGLDSVMVILLFCLCVFFRFLSFFLFVICANFCTSFLLIQRRRLSPSLCHGWTNHASWIVLLSQDGKGRWRESILRVSSVCRHSLTFMLVDLM